MDREVMLTILVLFVCGPALHVFGPLPEGSLRDRSGRRLEQIRWTRLWTPALPASLALCVLIGWALQEPADCDERVLPLVFLVVAPFALVAVRATARGLRALATRGHAPAGTVGLVRPRVFFTRVFVAVLDPEAVAAAQEHEAAHVRHRDPLRIWLAQFATDLQWPWPTAQRRFRAWLCALEMARDEEARVRGADGSDLAAAILTAARLENSGAPLAGLTGSGEALKERIARLLAPLPSDPPVQARRLPALIVLAAILGAFAFGLRDGEIVVRSLPGVETSVPS